jgi:hypothetical protein
MKPILCNTQVAQNILVGRQTQDRRPIKPQPTVHGNGSWNWNYRAKGIQRYGLTVDYMKKELPACAKYQPGDILYVRETWTTNFDRDCKPSEMDDNERILYYASQSKGKQAICRWRPNIHMPEKFSRIFLKVTKVRVERIRSISYDDVIAEGCESGYRCSTTKNFANLWESIYPGSWERNDWVFVYDFEKCERDL